MNRIFYILFAILVSSTAFSAVLFIEGSFRNKNLYVHNSFVNSGVGFCVKEIKVNGEITTDETNSSAFEIDLKALKLKNGQKVLIEIMHLEGCAPKILNLEDLKPAPTFEILMIHVNTKGLLKWQSRNESGVLPYTIEQFKWNKWITVGTVNGTGTSGPNDYSFVVPVHSGNNKYRVKQKGFNQAVKVSREVTMISQINKPSFAMPKDLSRIDFSSDTCYELYDGYGRIIKKGYGKHITTAELNKGSYYLCYDNEVTEFVK
jgi:hypothetical protein